MLLLGIIFFGLGAMSDWGPSCAPKRTATICAKTGAIDENATAACPKDVKLDQGHPMTSASGDS
jgi:hypothetical protein